MNKNQDIVIYEGGQELTLEEETAARAEIEAAAKLPYVYDPDSPLLTEKQLAEFRPVNFATWEERARAMREAEPLIIETGLTGEERLFPAFAGGVS